MDQKKANEIRDAERAVDEALGKTRDALATFAKQLEATQEEIRQERQRAKTQLQLSEQMANETHNALSQILKTLNAMRELSRKV